MFAEFNAEAPKLIDNLQHNHSISLKHNKKICMRE